MNVPFPLRRWLACALTVALACRGLGQAYAPEAVLAALSLHAQSTAIVLGYPSFPAPYTGPNSLPPHGHTSQTLVTSVSIGLPLWPGAALYADPEVDAGNVLNGSVGLAGFPNGELARSDSTTPVWGLPRFYLQQVIGLDGPPVVVAEGNAQVALTTRSERLTVTAGEFGAMDAFDSNAYAHDPQGQFMNWNLMDNPAWDFPDATYGWTDGLSVEWRSGLNAIRWGLFMEPKQPGGLSLDHDLVHVHGQALEWEVPYLLDTLRGTVRTLFFWNRARMGSFAQSLLYTTVDLAPSRALRSKAGAGISWDQALGTTWGIFARAGANDGRSETWSFTEADRALSAGLGVSGAAWERPADSLGVGWACDFLSGRHRQYLAAGGTGVVLGDGALAYRPEEVVECFYDWVALPTLLISPDLQWVQNPGYNHARGPVFFWALRVRVAR